MASPTADRLRRGASEATQLDRALYAAAASTPTPTLDVPLRRLSRAADHSLLWLGVAAVVAAIGGHRGRAVALQAMATVAVNSAIVNLLLKRVPKRARPERDAADVPVERQVSMPTSTSFPSGHSASAFAFATVIGDRIPVLGAPIRLLAGAVAYSRVHTGVHYPLDVIAGSLVGAMVGGWAVTLGGVAAGSRACGSTPTTGSS